MVGAFAVPSAGLVLGGVPLAVGTALLLVAATIAAGPLLATLERYRIRLVDDEPLPTPARPRGSRWRAPSTWRDRPWRSEGLPAGTQWTDCWAKGAWARCDGSTIYSSGVPWQ